MSRKVECSAVLQSPQLVCICLNLEIMRQASADWPSGTDAVQAIAALVWLTEQPSIMATTRLIMLGEEMSLHADDVQQEKPRFGRLLAAPRRTRIPYGLAINPERRAPAEWRACVQPSFCQAFPCQPLPCVPS